MVTLDCDVVVISSRVGELEKELRQQCRIERFEHSLDLTDSQSKVRIQIQMNDQLQSLLPRKRKAIVLDREMFVTSFEDLLASKIDAPSNQTRKGPAGHPAIGRGAAAVEAIGSAGTAEGIQSVITVGRDSAFTGAPVN